MEFKEVDECMIKDVGVVGESGMLSDYLVTVDG